MTVYVDDVRHQFGRMIMCHLWADTLEELHDFATKIGMRRQWFQQPPKASWEHYDISLGKKELALSLGAVLTDKYGPSEFTSRQRLKHPDVEARKRARKMLANIKKCRAMGFGKGDKV